MAQTDQMQKPPRPKTVLYFGLFDPGFGRNKIFIEGLRRSGVEVLVCTDSTPGFRKFWKLFRMHRKFRHSYDLMIVGYPPYIIAPLARLIATAPVACDTMDSFYETTIVSRGSFANNPFRIQYARFVDWLNIAFAERIFVGTDNQKEHFIEDLGASARKMTTVYNGVDDSSFYFDPNVKKYPRFTVLFRGRINIEAGMPNVIRAAKILEREGVDFLIIGFGWDHAIEEFDRVMKEENASNIRHIRRQVPIGELRDLMLSCHVSLGQLSDNERLWRGTSHKVFESLAMRLPYVTARAGAVQEIMTEGTHCLMVNPNDPEDLAAKIRLVRDDPALSARLAEAGFALYKEKFAPEKVVRPILDILDRPVQ